MISFAIMNSTFISGRKRFIAFVLLIAFVNLSVDISVYGNTENDDRTNQASDPINSITELILEAGFDYQEPISEGDDRQENKPPKPSVKLPFHPIKVILVSIYFTSNMLMSRYHSIEEQNLNSANYVPPEFE